LSVETIIHMFPAQQDALFDKLMEVAQGVQPELFIETPLFISKIEELKGAFLKDSARVADIAELLFHQDITAYGPRATAVFERWATEGGSPSMPALVAHAMNHFKIEAQSPYVPVLLMAALLAEYPNELQYHGNEHYRKVLFHVIRLTATHNDLFARSEWFLSPDEVARLLIASCIHDLGHEGGDNQRDGIYTPGYMEQRAFNVARPYFEALGLDKKSQGEIETMVFCTDITFFAGDNSPCLRMKKIYKHYFWDDNSEDVSLMLMGKLRRYEDNPQLAQMAMILHESDIGTSAGLSYEQTIKETLNIMGERGQNSAGPQTVLAFLREQLGETMFTEAGKQVFGSEMVNIVDHAESDVRAGRKQF